MGFSLILYVSVVGALVGSLQFGYQQGVLNTAWSQIAIQFQYDTVESWQTAFINLCYFLGAAVGSLFAGVVADSVGPKSALIINALVFIAGSLISGFSNVGKIGLIMFTIGRFISGLASGAASLLSPRYITEIAPVNNRGLLGTLNQVFLCFGKLVSFVAGLPYQLQGQNVSPNQWRYQLIFSGLLSLIQILILVGMPESFVWFQMKGESKKAEQSGLRLHGKKWVPLELQTPLVRKNSSVNSMAPISLCETFGKKYSLFVSLGILVVVFKQFSGNTTVTLYSTTVFQNVHFSNAVVGSIIAGGFSFLGVIIATFLVDRSGRKVLLLTSHMGMFICCAYIALIEWLPLRQDSALVSYSVLFSILIYIFFYSVGCGPIPWLYLAEIMPPQIKGKVAAIATSLKWISCVIVVAAFPLMLKGLGTGPSYGVFAITNIIAFVYLALYMVETKKISMEEIERKLTRDDTAYLQEKEQHSEK